MADSPVYCIVDVPNSLVFPADVAMKLFPLLCQGEPVKYDWSDTVHKRIKPDRDGCTIRQFTVAQYAQLALNDDAG